MAKTIITSAGDEGEAPFLRGILTRSLQDAGLDFDTAYKIASGVRDDINDRNQVSRKALRSLVARHLLKSGHEDVLQNYESRATSTSPIMVRKSDDTIAPFSRGVKQKRLESCGISTEEAVRITRIIYDHLIKRERSEISSVHLSRLTYGALKRMSKPEYAHNYLVWTDFVQSGRPLLLLIGGTAGSGKSTIATDVANRLDIVRAQSTDMLREVMRVLIPERLLPVLHTSSFNAWTTFPETPDNKPNEMELMKAGYRAQAELVSVSCEAVLKRAVQERVSLVLEGVHVRPGIVDLIPAKSDAVVVPIMLAILDKKKLELRIKGRGHNIPMRRSERYLKNFDAIWRLQSSLLDEADKAGVAIIANDDKDVAVQEVLATVIDTIGQEFVGTPAEVFAEAQDGWASSLVNVRKTYYFKKNETQSWKDRIMEKLSIKR